ncbi:YTH domain-containing family protein 3 [Labeo rohita]|uniref:YTH domain-containing family protein 3 n=1 Tax=Labeo rohita TaxID=84645 RepID=A0ABQ8L0Q8_LABRO|nr:YTH domain-containing family protein 3 [Labeo rohita]
MDKSALDSATLMELRRFMASLVVLERHLWLTLTEIKDADKVPFLDATGLFGPAVEGFAVYFSAVQKTSQAMQRFLPKRFSSAAASGCLKSVPPQQPVKPAPAATAASAQPAKPEPRQASETPAQVGAGSGAPAIILISGTGRGGGKVSRLPSQQISFLGAVFDLTQMRAIVVPD